MYAFLNGIDGKRKKKIKPNTNKKIVGWPTHQVIYHMGFTWVSVDQSPLIALPSNLELVLGSTLGGNLETKYM